MALAEILAALEIPVRWTVPSGPSDPPPPAPRPSGPSGQIARRRRRNVAASRLPIAPFPSIRFCFGFRASDFGFPSPPACVLRVSAVKLAFRMCSQAASNPSHCNASNAESILARRSLCLCGLISAVNSGFIPFTFHVSRFTSTCGLISVVNSGFMVRIRISLPRNALGLADHPFQLLRAGVGAIDFGHAAQATEQPVRGDFAGVGAGH